MVVICIDMAIENTILSPEFFQIRLHFGTVSGQEIDQIQIARTTMPVLIPTWS